MPTKEKVTILPTHLLYRMMFGTKLLLNCFFLPRFIEKVGTVVTLSSSRVQLMEVFKFESFHFEHLNTVHHMDGKQLT